MIDNQTINSETINSDVYWNGRFSTDWTACEGPQQSRFFSQLTATNLPAWLLAQLKNQALSIADWGCAQGDGTEVLANSVAHASVIGVEFSSVAVEQARKRYPYIQFVCEDWLSEDCKATTEVDVLFSSNTLEHFHDPYNVLQIIAARAKKAIVLTLPYREQEQRIDEHFYSFLPENIPLQLSNGFRLVNSRVIDCRDLEDTYWDGEQIILVYADPTWMINLSLTLGDSIIEQNPWQTTLLRYDTLLGNLRSEIDTVSKENKSQSEALAQYQRKLVEISSWAQQIQSSPIRYAIKKYALMASRYCFKHLPLSLDFKHKLRAVVKRIASHRMDNAYVSMPTIVDLDQNKPRDILFFSVIDWHFRIQRPQQLARGFAKTGDRVFYLSNQFVDSATPGYQIEQLDTLHPVYQVKLHVKGAPAIYFAPPTPQAQAMLEASFARFALDYAIISSTVIIEHAYWYDLARRLPNTQHIYDCMDHHEGFGNVPDSLVTVEKNMLRHADLVVVTSSWLEKFAREYTDKIAIVRNACEYQHFSRKPPSIYIDQHNRKIIGYYGAIAEWFDIELVDNIAKANPDALVLLVGNDTVNAQSALEHHKNIQFTGEVPYAELPFYLYAFDVCILPFKVIPLTLATNPVKIYEYLAAGKPVVSTDLPELLQFGEVVQRAKCHDEFLTQLQQGLNGEIDDSKIEQRKQFAAVQTWDHRITELKQAVQTIPLPKVSVIVLTYNNLPLTKACLASLVEVSDYTNLEIIVVDNASADGTPTYLREFQLTHPTTKFILNEKNVGFAAGNNIGLAAATGDYIVLLNNDTVVTRGWVSSLLRHLQNDHSIGLIGPVTNNIGNEARISTQYTHIADMPAEAFQYTLTHMGEIRQIKTVAFFCVMFSRSTYEKCGPLCEEYGLGFFEDDDYCRRAEAAGLKIICAQDVFIHHHLHASFNKLSNKSRQDLMARNKAIYESKWGRWEPHAHRSGQY